MLNGSGRQALRSGIKFHQAPGYRQSHCSRLFCPGLSGSIDLHFDFGDKHGQNTGQVPVDARKTAVWGYPELPTWKYKMTGDLPLVLKSSLSNGSSRSWASGDRPSCTNGDIVPTHLPPLGILVPRWPSVLSGSHGTQKPQCNVRIGTLSGSATPSRRTYKHPLNG